MEKIKKYLTQICTFIFGLFTVGLITAYRGGLKAKTVTEFMFALTDGFFIVGILLTCFGLLTVVSAGGAFDMLLYSINVLGSLFSKEKRKDKDFYAYTERKKEERKEKKSVSFLLCIGGIFLFIALILLFAFHLY